METLGEEEVSKLLEAGRIAWEALRLAERLVQPGASARRVCESIESFIVEKGARPAFPCNFSVDHVAAHYTPGIDDDVELEGGEVVKVDVGVHVDGYIADTAITIDLSGKHEPLLEAARSALEAAMKVVKPNVRVYDIGRRIEAAIRSKGFKPIRNLTGHTIARWTIHAGMSIPNYADRRTIIFRLPPGTLVAIEPFATNGRGFVRDSQPVNIYAYTGRRPRAPLSEAEEKVLSLVTREYRTLPFTPRWLAQRLPRETVIEGVRGLLAKGLLHDYPVLVEAGRGLVAQFEHTFLILKDRVIVTTCPDCG